MERGLSWELVVSEKEKILAQNRREQEQEREKERGE